MTVTLRRPLTYEECQTIRLWRNDPDVMPMLRTGYKTTAQQAEFYYTHIAPGFWQRTFWRPEHRYYAVTIHDACVGVTGLTYLLRVPGEAEISLVLGPMYRRVGIGSKAVDLILEEAWRLGLSAVIGECYAFGNVRFWRKQAERRGAQFEWHPEAHSWRWRWGRPA